MHLPPRRHGWTLLLDADDTLWENGIFFERAIAAFIEHLDHSTHTAAEVRAYLDACERRTIAEWGYGSRSFQRSLTSCFEQLSSREVRDTDQLAIASFADTIARHEMLLLEHVEATLTQLAGRHKLLLVTKGDDVEQRDKLQRSGLADLFTAVEVVREKNSPTYLQLIRDHALVSERTCMIGNSPRSDINPALAAGLHAVLIAHPCTWTLECDDLLAPEVGQMLLQLDTFRDLLLHF